MFTPDVEELQRYVHDVDAGLDLWDDRIEDAASPRCRPAANEALDGIDGALKELHRLRERLIGQMREYDDAPDARVS